MKKENRIYKVLVVIGTVLVWLPLLLPLFFGLANLVVNGQFRFDYLMPMELFLLVLAGGILLVFVAWRVHAHLALLGGSLAIAVAMLLGAQATAVITGLASGLTLVGGWEWILVLLQIAFYFLAVATLGIGGLWLLRDLYLTGQHHTSQ